MIYTGYIGTYTQEPLGHGEGIYFFRMDGGHIEEIRLAVTSVTD
jgi:6-phosphogluconolactonase (cycloisomerase 2 family)